MTTPSRRGYTGTAMKRLRQNRGSLLGARIDGPPQRALLVAGSAWEAVRFFLVLHLLAVLLAGGAGLGPWLLPWLLFGASGSLLAAAGGVLLAAFPRRYEALLGLLRLGKIIGIFAFVLLMVCGALSPVADRAVGALGPLVIPLGPLMLGIFALDLLLLAFLCSLRAEGGTPGPHVEMPGYSESEVGHYH